MRCSRLLALAAAVAVETNQMPDASPDAAATDNPLEVNGTYDAASTYSPSARSHRSQQHSEPLDTVPPKPTAQ